MATLAVAIGPPGTSSKYLEIAQNLLEKYQNSGDKKFEKTPEQIKAEGIKTSGAHLKNRIKAYIARTFWQTEAFFRIINQVSPEVQKAIKVINDKTFEEMKIANK